MIHIFIGRNPIKARQSKLVAKKNQIRSRKKFIFLNHTRPSAGSKEDQGQPSHIPFQNFNLTLIEMKSFKRPLEVPNVHQR